MNHGMRKGKLEWVLSFGLLAACCVAGLFASHASPAAAPGTLVSGDIAWMLTATGLVLLMTPGLAFFYGGMVHRKNVISTMLQSFVCMGVLSLLWVAVGFSLSFGDSIGGVIGDPRTYLFFDKVGAAADPRFAATIPLALFAMFQLKFAIITPALITGSFAERVRFSSYLLFIVLFSLLIYCPLAHWTWHPQGFLRAWGVLDFAGGTVVHMSAGFAALAGAIFLGRRDSHAKGVHSAPAHIPNVMLGTGMLWFGWFGFNAGSALAANETAVLAFITTNTASAAAMLAWIFFDAVRGVRPSALGACIGAVVGLVAVTPAAGFITVGQSAFIGMLASLVSNVAVQRKAKSRLDDTLDVFPCHGVGGMVGMVATGVFADKVGLIHGDPTIFLRHLAALAGVAVFTFGGSYALYKLTDAAISLRVRPDQEEAGLDLSQHAESLG
jgi:Amt family ammonium transporter